MSNDRYVFISYTQDDGEIAASLASGLKDAGVRSFLAQRDVSAGTNWNNSIRTALKNSKIVLCLITPNSKDSAWVHVEAGAAWVLEKPILPVMMFVKPDELIEILHQHQGRKIETPQQFGALVDEIRQVILPEYSLFEQQRDIEGEGNESEAFTVPETWNDLLRVGSWSFDDEAKIIKGGGIHNYILSSQHYADPIRIRAALRFTELFPLNRHAAVNAGIVFGWATPAGVRRYFNLKINEGRLLLELIGSRGGDAYLDFQHIDDGIPFELVAGTTYVFQLELRERNLDVRVQNNRLRWAYACEMPEAVIGRVGFRPWRSLVEIESFEVVALVS